MRVGKKYLIPETNNLSRFLLPQAIIQCPNHINEAIFIIIDPLIRSHSTLSHLPGYP